ncbi:hypothetical protein A3F08_01550 [Candidatus Berkelbacteria bacterium RIFCSPHIGHO2_12_FULL_36_9]|uniref:Peptidase C51 domain-containing protein n=1 Tax=Candidatus Berkelbacteria bacterium RIFCSPHIGHO2_12_FULL_36_9 TaxID=1797469 RepID=A0A1F5EK66_9BACT|nr:MAG: hypothetical protein A3F08_01550 [Candidatus Berkelbacteria bacterium RIFCSPHIGHO2_12_FULL_36_9]
METLKNAKGLFKFILKRIIIIYLSLIIITGNSLAYFGESKDIIVAGETEKVAKTIDDISLFTPFTEIKAEGMLKTENQDNYLNKPEIISTRTRVEIEKEKKIEKQKQLAAAQRTVVLRENTTSRYNNQTTLNNQPRTYNGYFYGFCTWYVANKRQDIPNNWGNAKSWLNSAQNDGRITGKNPQVGAIMVTKESWAGHVGYVEKVDGNEVTISEMNYRGWGRINSRTLNINDSVIRGYIY